MIIKFIVWLKKYISISLFIGTAFFCCNQSATIESNDAIMLLNNDDYYFLDVRTLKEHENISIPSTDCIPVQEIEERMDELNDYRDKKIIVYCRSGNRSGIATKILSENGFNALNMIGGMNGWKGKVEKEN